MFELGASLRDARLRRSLELEEVEEATRISRRYLRALEEERFELLPGDAYAKAFLRSYADFLGLDAKRYADEYTTRLAEQAHEPALAPARVPQRRRGRPRAALHGWQLLIGVVVAVLAVLAWQFGGSGSAPRRVAHPASVRAAAPAATAKLPPAPHPKAPQPMLLLSLKAVRGSCWLDVHLGSPTGTAVYIGTLAQGRTIRFSLRRPLWIRLGDPASLDATIAGKPLHGLPTQTANLLVTKTGLRPA
jgi:cytoskeleton protein RodZ